MALVQKRGRGRPRKQALKIIGPENNRVINEPKQFLNSSIQEIENKITKIKDNSNRPVEDPYEDLKQLAEIVRIIQRAAKGLGANDDVFQGLINVNDIRERTRLTETSLLSHSAMRVIAEELPELGLYGKIADMEDPYYISEEGEGRKEGILLQQAKSKQDANLVLNMPNTQGGQAQDPQFQGPSKPGGIRGIINKITHR